MNGVGMGSAVEGGLHWTDKQGNVYSHELGNHTGDIFVKSFPVGTSTVTCSKTDDTGNSGSASFTVTVNNDPNYIQASDCSGAPSGTSFNQSYCLSHSAPVTPYITVPDDITITTSDIVEFNLKDELGSQYVGNLGNLRGAIAWNGGGVDFNNVQSTDTSQGGMLLLSGPDIVRNPSQGGNGCYGDFYPQGWLNGPVTFPIGTTTVTCGAVYGGVERTASFTVTIIEDTTSNFRTVQTFSGASSCIGYENVPSGTGHVRLLGPQEGNSAWYYEDLQWYSGANVGGGQTCTNNQMAGEYQFAAFSGSLTSNLNMANLIEFATPIILESWSYQSPSLTIPNDIIENTTSIAGATISFTATLEARGQDLEMSSNNVRCWLPGQNSWFDDDPNITVSNSIYTESLQTFELSGIFPIGSYTIQCNGYDIHGINANRDGDEFPTFDITVNLLDTDSKLISITTDTLTIDTSIPNPQTSTVSVDYQNIDSGTSYWTIKTPDMQEYLWTISGTSETVESQIGTSFLTYEINSSEGASFATPRNNLIDVSSFDSFLLIVSDGPLNDNNTTRDFVEFQIIDSSTPANTPCTCTNPS